MIEIADGFHYGMNDEDYFALPFANQSALKTLCLGGTPAHYRAKKDGDEKDSNGKKFGKLVHQALLTPKVLENVQLLPSNIKQRRGKEWDALHAAYPEVNFMPPAEWQTFIEERDVAYRVRDSILNDPVAGNFFNQNIKTEVVIIWTDKESGVRCKGRLDVLGNDFSFICDTKTTAKFIPYQVFKSGYYFGYHVQSAMYTDAICTLTGKDFNNPPRFWFIFIEKEPPYLILVADGHAAYDERMDVSDPLGYLKLGREQYKYWIKVVADCQKKNEWPGHPSEPMEMIIPKFAGMEGVYE